VKDFWRFQRDDKRIKSVSHRTVAGLFQRGSDDFRSKLGLAALLFIDAVKDRARVKPYGNSMHIFRRHFQAVVTFFQ